MITKSNIDIQEYLKEKKILIDEHLSTLFNSEEFQSTPALWEAVKYSTLNGGKRLRAAMCISTFESLYPNKKELLKDCLYVASAIELIHSMSLIHDDLPCMDNDDLRRGKPSCHKAFSEEKALLAGDAMLTLATYIITEKCKNIIPENKCKIVNEISKTFTFGLVPGQVLDIDLAGKNNDLEKIDTIYKLKTASLIKSSIVCGALIAFEESPKSNEIISKLSNFGYKIGKSFQIIDDVLDITSDTKTLGKTAGKDIEQEKTTYPNVIGVEKSKKVAIELISEAKDEIKSINLSSDNLLFLSDLIVNRIN